MELRSIAAFTGDEFTEWAPVALNNLSSQRAATAQFMLSAIISLIAACDLLASYAATPLAAARNKAPGYQASFGVRRWSEGATITVEYVNAGACTLAAVDEPALAQGMLDLPRASVSVLSHAPPKFSLTFGPTPTNAACATDDGGAADEAVVGGHLCRRKVRRGQAADAAA